MLLAPRSCLVDLFRKQRFHFAILRLPLAVLLLSAASVIAPQHTFADGTTSFGSPGTYSYTVPTGATSVSLYMVGGGGGGGGDGGIENSDNNGVNGGGGGGAGGYNITTVNVTPGSTYTVIVGKGGTAGTGHVDTNGECKADDPCQGTSGTWGGNTLFEDSSGTVLAGAYAGAPGTYGWTGHNDDYTQWCAQSGTGTGGAGGYPSGGNGGQGQVDRCSSNGSGNGAGGTNPSSGAGWGGKGGYSSSSAVNGNGGVGGYMTVTPLYADLTVTANVAPTTATAGTAVSLSDVVQNIGTGSTINGFTDLFKVSMNATDHSDKQSIGTYSSGAIAAGSSNTASLSYTFPSAGTYYVNVCADASYIGDTGTISESNEGNNCGPWTAITVAAAPQPNLTATTNSTAISGTTGQSVTLSGTVSNIGNASTGASFHNVATVCNPSGCNYFQATVATNDAGPLAPNAYQAVSSTYTLPSTPGSYVYTICADVNTSWQGSIAESNENDNCGTWTSITVTAPALPNLTPGITPPANVTATLGQPIPVAGSALNNGTAAAGAFNNMFVTNLNSDQTAWNTIISGSSVSGLAVNASAPTSATFPANTFSAPGTYSYAYCVGVNTSWQFSLTESNTGDNCSGWGTITINAPALPDLTAANVTVSPSAPTTAYPATLSAVISDAAANTGAAFTDLFQRATDSSGSNATDIGTYSSAALSAGGSNTATLSYTFPSAATWYVRACADKRNMSDTNGVIAESNESNNCSSGWTAITVGNPPPPSCNSLTATPSTVDQGNASVLTWSSTNATSCTGSGFSTGGAANNSKGVSVTPTVPSTNYGITCTNAYGTCSVPVTVTVTPNACITASADLEASAIGGTETPTTIRVKQPTSPGAPNAVIYWNGATGPGSCSITPSIPVGTPTGCNVSGNQPVSVSTQTTYTLNCNGTTDSVTIDVVPNFQEF